MIPRTRPDRAPRAAALAAPLRAGDDERAPRPDIVAALRFRGLGFDSTRLAELRRRGLRPPVEAAR